MELLLLLSALICGLTDTVRTVVVRAPQAIEARVAAATAPASAVARALAWVAVRVVPTYPVIAPRLVLAMPVLAPLVRVAPPAAPERRRE